MVGTSLENGTGVPDEFLRSRGIRTSATLSSMFFFRETEVDIFMPRRWKSHCFQRTERVNRSCFEHASSNMMWTAPKNFSPNDVLGIRFIWFWAKHLRADIQPFWQTMCSICTDWCHSCWGIGSRYPCRWGLSAICLTGNFYCYALKQIYRNMILVETFLGVCNMKSVSINSWEHHQLLRRRNRLIITSLCMVSCEGRKQLHPTSRVWKKQNVVRDSGKHSFLAVSNLFVHSKKCLAWYRLNLPRRAVLSGHMFWRSQRHSLSWTMSASIGVSCARDLGTRLLAQNILFHDISQGVLASNGDSL